MLRDNDRKYVESLKNRYKTGNVSAASGAERVRIHRIREKASQAIIDLTTLARALPEEQAQQIFSEKDIRPLVEAIVLGSRDDASLPRQLSIAALFIGVGMSFSRRLQPQHGEDVGLALDQVRTVLIAANLKKVRSASE